MGGLILRPGDRIGPYIYERPLATGGMAHVLLATGPDNRTVALKVLKAGRMGTGLGRFRREFRALSRLNHPNIVRVDAYGDIHGHPYIAMEYVQGRDLHQTIRSFRKLPHAERWRRAEEILVDMAQALAHIHKRGLVHRDLKPSNILVDLRGRCKLTDFGIVKDLDPSSDPFVSTTLVGTWAYASPEQISGAKIDHRSDIYSLGVILYAVLTGRRPFVARDMAGYLEAHRDQEPTPPSTFEPDVPARIEAICLRMLQKAPRDRFQSAQEILVQLERIDPADQDGATTDEVIWEPPMVGRDVQLDQLRDAVSALTRGEGGVVLIEGSEGTGHSRMMKAGVDFARLIGIPSHAARVAPGEGAFDSLLRLSETIGRELGPRTPPELAEAIGAFAKGQGQLAGDLRYRLYDGVRSALETLLGDGPQILAIDDLHNAPAPLADLVMFLIRAVVMREQLPLLVLLCARSDVPVGPLSPLGQGQELGDMLVRIQLSALDEMAVHQMVAGLIGDGDRAQQIATRLSQETGGNPFFVAEFLRAILQRGDTRADAALGKDDDATEILEPQTAIPPGVRRVVRERISHHPDDEREIIELIAVAGRELDLDVLLDALDTDEDAALDRVDRTVDAGLLVERRSGMQSMLDFAQRKVAEVVYQDLHPTRLAELHGRLALVLDERFGDKPLAAQMIGEHYRRAGQPAKAYHYLARAAGHLRERTLMGEAWSVAERAGPLEARARVELSTDTFSRDRLELLRVRGQALFNRGAWADASDALLALRHAALALGDDTIADVAALDRGNCLWRLGEKDDGRLLVKGVLAQARARHDRATIIDAIHRLAVFAWESGDLDQTERLASEGLISATGPELAPRRAEILMALGAVKASRGELAGATQVLEEAREILKNLGQKRVHAMVLCNLAELYDWQGQMGRAFDQATEALGMARDVLYREGEAFAQQVRALVLLEVGDLVRATEVVQRALAINEETGIAADLVPTLYLYGRIALGLGEAEKAISLLRAGLGAAAQQDPENYQPALTAALARSLALFDDKLEAQQILGELSPAIDGLDLPRRVQVLILAAGAWMALGQADRALPLLRRAAQDSLSRGLLNWAFRSHVLIGQIAPEDEARRAREQARAIVHRVMDTLPEDLAAPYRNQAHVRAALREG